MPIPSLNQQLFAVDSAPQSNTSSTPGWLREQHSSQSIGSCIPQNVTQHISAASQPYPQNFGEATYIIRQDAVQKKYNEVLDERALQDRIYHEMERLSACPMLSIPARQCLAPVANLENIPEEMRSLAFHLANIYNIGVDGFILLLLGTMSLAMRGRYVVDMGFQSWQEPLVDYLVLLADSGMRKTAIIDTLTQPFKAFIEEKNAAIPSCSATKVDITKKMCKKFVDNQIAGKFNPGKSFSELAQDADDIAHAVEAFKKCLTARPVELFFDNATKIGLATRMALHGECLSCLAPEGDFFKGTMLQESNDPSLLLKSHTMESYQYSSKNVGDIALQKPALPMIHFVQLEACRNIQRNETLTGKGLTARFQYYFFSSELRKYPVTAEQGEALLGKLFQKVRRMLERNYTQEVNRRVFSISVTPEARQLALEFEEENRKIIMGGVPIPMQSWLRKSHGQAVRFAGDIHAFLHDEPEKYPITAESMYAGIAIMVMLTHHADWFFAPDKQRATVNAGFILRWIRRWSASKERFWSYSSDRQHEWFSFTIRDVQQGVTQLKHSAEEIRAAIDILKNCNILGEILVEKNSPMYILHPNF